MTLSEYSRLKQQIKSSVGSSERHACLLDTLKGLFREEINSPRRSETIVTISHLMNVLELRDALSEDNVNPLKKIAQTLPNSSELLNSISQYETSHIAREYGNYYAPEKTQAAVSIAPAPTVVSSNPYGQMSPTKKQRILRTIEDEIGNSWRDLARNLKIREKVINEIDHNYKPLASKASKLLEVYLEYKADPDKWFFELCEALNKSRRKDLSKSITKTLTMNNI